MNNSLGTLAEPREKIEIEVNQNSEPISGVNIIYQFKDVEGSFQLRLQDGKRKVVQELNQQADCTLIMFFDSFQTMAFMTGKLKIHGDLTKVIKLETILKQYNFSD